MGVHISFIWEAGYDYLYSLRYCLLVWHAAWPSIKPLKTKQKNSRKGLVLNVKKQENVVTKSSINLARSHSGSFSVWGHVWQACSSVPDCNRLIWLLHVPVWYCHQPPSLSCYHYCTCDKAVLLVILHITTVNSNHALAALVQKRSFGKLPLIGRKFS